MTLSLGCVAVERDVARITVSGPVVYSGRPYCTMPLRNGGPSITPSWSLSSREESEGTLTPSIDKSNGEMGLAQFPLGWGFS